MLPKVPRSVTFPGDYHITVSRLNKNKADNEMGSGVYAQWDVDDHLILLRSERAGQNQREDFVHEMEHAFIDWKDWFLGKSEHYEG